MSARRTDTPDPRHPEISVDEFVRAVLDRMQSPERRVIPYYRLVELTPPFSKTWIRDRIADGTLKTGRLFGLTLIDGDSLDTMLEKIDWTKGGA